MNSSKVRVLTFDRLRCGLARALVCDFEGFEFRTLSERVVKPELSRSLRSSAHGPGLCGFEPNFSLNFSQQIFGDLKADVSRFLLF